MSIGIFGFLFGIGWNILNSRESKIRKIKTLFISLGIVLKAAIKKKSIKKGKIKKILVIKYYGVGNMILFTPALKSLRKEFRNAQITIMVNSRGVKDIIDNGEYVDEFIEFDANRDFLKKPYIDKIREKKYDLVIISFPAYDTKVSFFASLVTRRYIVGFDYRGSGFLYTRSIKADIDEHEAEVNLRITKAIGINDLVRKINIFVSDSDREYADRILRDTKVMLDKKIIGFHAGSYSDMIEKRWSEEKFAQLGDELIEKYSASIILFGGKEEISLNQRIASKMKNPSFNLAGISTIRQTAALISRCNLFISNDTGLMHIAVAVNVPVIAIFGPTNQNKNSPYRDKREYRIVRKELRCNPCYPPAPIKCNNVECLQSIDVADVMAMVLGLKIFY